MDASFALQVEKSESEQIFKLWNPLKVSGLTKIAQSAEALLFITNFFGKDACILKYRPRKGYRHPDLDKQITRQRCINEARLLQRCRKSQIAVPAIYLCDVSRGCIWMELIDGRSIRDFLSQDLAAFEPKPDDDFKENPGFLQNQCLIALMVLMGKTIAKLHISDIVHGDLTTSNLILRFCTADDQVIIKEKKLQMYSRSSIYFSDQKAVIQAIESANIYIIDFGLGQHSKMAEDKAVDLYVLERALLSTHPETERFFAEFLKAYITYDSSLDTVCERLQKVRLRGRKRSMAG